MIDRGETRGKRAVLGDFHALADAATEAAGGRLMGRPVGLAVGLVVHAGNVQQDLEGKGRLIAQGKRHAEQVGGRQHHGDVAVLAGKCLKRLAEALAEHVAQGLGFG